ncbi:NUDIX domain-containing protein [Woeseia oceani]|uniref:NUDIX hydrolase n=1 Tax=Woeseia oceani TaxID=1548547 RepID=A0A193LK71_9GAMM|nr:NUDIX domain-containing protein [Woeseia oceani]ANO52799.1 NUDIX hydrolase [Woeseia oceani]
MDSGERLSCGIVLGRPTDDGWYTLMLRAWRIWDFPKGMCEPGETPLQAARREVAEETGIRELALQWGDTAIDTGPYNRGKTARYYLASTREDKVEMGISPLTGRPEHHEYRWMTFDEAYDISSPRVRSVVVWARQIIGT